MPDHVRKLMSEINKGNKHCLGRVVSERTRELISNSHRGKPRPDMRGDNNPAKRPDVRKKISESKKGDKNSSKRPEVRKKIGDSARGRHTTTITRDRISKALMGHPVSIDARLAISKAKVGSANPQWKDGMSYLPYPPEFNNKYKERVRYRFNNTCYLCARSKEANNNRNMSVHHIDYNKGTTCNEKSWKFVPLCNSCSTKVNYERWYWFNLLINYWLNNPEIHFNRMFD